MKSIRTKYAVFAIIICAVFVSAAVYIINRGKTSENRQSGVTPTPIVSETPTVPAATPEPSITPTPTPEPTPAPIKATLVSARDCVIHTALQKAAKIEGEDRYDFTHMFEEIKPFIESADYSIVSYEGAATNNRNDYAGFPSFNCPP